MRLAARKFAVLLWVGAVILAIQIWYSFTRSSVPINVPVSEFRLRLIVGDFAWTVFYSGGFFILGAIIWLLGDIRDRLDPGPEREEGDEHA